MAGAKTLAANVRLREVKPARRTRCTRPWTEPTCPRRSRTARTHRGPCSVELAVAARAGPDGELSVEHGAKGMHGHRVRHREAEPALSCASARAVRATDALMRHCVVDGVTVCPHKSTRPRLLRSCRPAGRGPGNVAAAHGSVATACRQRHIDPFRSSSSTSHTGDGYPGPRSRPPRQPALWRTGGCICSRRRPSSGNSRSSVCSSGLVPGAEIPHHRPTSARCRRTNASPILPGKHLRTGGWHKRSCSRSSGGSARQRRCPASPGTTKP